MPILWIAGLHDESRLFVRDLQPNSGTPILGRNPEANMDLLNPSAEDETSEIEPELYELEDDELEDGNREDSWRDEDDEGGFGDITGECLEDLARREFEGQGKLGKLRAYREQLLILAEAMEDQTSHANLSVMPDPTPENTADLLKWANEYHARRQEMEEKKAKALSYSKKLHHLIHALEHTLEYEPTHPHVRETPDPTTAQHATMMKWGENWHRLENGRVMVPTWSPSRSGNIFR